MKKQKDQQNIEKVRLIAISIVSILVVITGVFFSYGSFKNQNSIGGILSIIIVLVILFFALSVYKRGNKDLKNGFPIRDERSKKVMEKASSLAFHISLYLLLAIGFISEDLIRFRDVSQAISLTVGCMALLFAIFWVYYNNREL